MNTIFTSSRICSSLYRYFSSPRFYSFTVIYNFHFDFQQSHLLLQVPKGLVHSLVNLHKNEMRRLVLSTVRFYCLPVSISNISFLCIQPVGNKPLQDFIPLIFPFHFVSLCVHVMFFKDWILWIVSFSFFFSFYFKKRQLGMSSRKIVETLLMGYWKLFIKNLPIDFHLDIFAV